MERAKTKQTIEKLKITNREVLRISKSRGGIKRRVDGLNMSVCLGLY